MNAGATIQSFRSYDWAGGTWVPSPGPNGQPHTPEDFAAWFDAPKAYVPREYEVTNPTSWSGSDTNSALKVKWVFAGVNDYGDAVSGEGIVDCEP